MSLLNELIRDAKLTKAEAERKRQQRLEVRRGQDRAGRERRKAQAQAQAGLSNLPIPMAVKAAPEPPTPPKPVDATVEDLVSRLTAIKERIFRLHAMFATSLSFDCAIEANKFVALFQEVALELKAKQPEALENLVRGHESLLLSPPIQVRRTTIPIETQRSAELQWEVGRTPARRKPTPPTVSDGLDWLVS